MGLGGISEISLKDARGNAEQWRNAARDGVVPVKERGHLRRVAARNLHILKDIAEDAFESRKAELKVTGWRTMV